MTTKLLPSVAEARLRCQGRGRRGGVVIPAISQYGAIRPNANDAEARRKRRFYRAFDGTLSIGVPTAVH